MKYLEAGPKESMRNADQRLWSVGIIGSAWKHVKMYEGVGIELLRSGSNISAWIMSAKME